jgi:glyoxylase-like metal-dependent hydrolase (beta-lactamase superfamily II)
MLLVNQVDEGLTQFIMSRRVFGKSFYRAACYLYGGILIDTGMHHAEREFMSAIAKYKIETIVNTHSHEDHIGNNAPLQRRYGVSILAHRDAIPILAHPPLFKLKLYQRFLFGLPRPSKAKPIGEEVASGSVRLEVVNTPGHSPDHIVLFDREKGRLFSGDAYIGGFERLLRADIDIYGVIDSYRALLKLPVKEVYPGSGKVVSDPLEVFKRKIEYLETAGKNVKELHGMGMSEKVIAQKLFGNDLRMRLFTAGHFSAINLVRSFLSR